MTEILGLGKDCGFWVRKGQDLTLMVWPFTLVGVVLKIRCVPYPALCCTFCHYLCYLGVHVSTGQPEFLLLVHVESWVLMILYRVFFFWGQGSLIFFKFLIFYRHKIWGMEVPAHYRCVNSSKLSPAKGRVSITIQYRTTPRLRTSALRPS